MLINRETIDRMESRYRGNFINSLNGYKSANLIGTLSKEGISNLAIFNSVIHIGANPPLMGFILRPTTVPRHSYENITENGYYTINSINEEIIAQSHHTAAKYERNESEFDKTELNEEIINDFPIPFVKESNIKIGLKFVEEYLIKANNTTMLIGEVLQVIISEELIDADGSINHPEAKTVAISGLDTYLRGQLINKLPYAKPKKHIL